MITASANLCKVLIGQKMNLSVLPKTEIMILFMFYDGAFALSVKSIIFKIWYHKNNKNLISSLNCWV